MAAVEVPFLVGRGPPVELVKRDAPVASLQELPVGSAKTEDAIAFKLHADGLEVSGLTRKRASLHQRPKRPAVHAGRRLDSTEIGERRQEVDVPHLIVDDM